MPPTDGLIASRWIIALAALNGLMAVGAGAFGAHAVGDVHTRELLHTGAQYQLAHAVAALAVSRLRLGEGAAWAGRLFGVGGLAFGASLYLLALTGVRLWGAITPVGGVLLLAGWATLLVASLAGSRPPLMEAPRARSRIDAESDRADP